MTHEELVKDLVEVNAPRVFAVVQEEDGNPDAWVAAWGMAFFEHAEVVTVGGDFRMRLGDPEGAVAAFTGPQVGARLVWV
ncbi:hypothetical protein [Actinosynnema sp. NPDC020468]|uniref:hypothetical protein n=1 Tax=Actinosynnema sp. NPDC020468 TaxID=3154488 RepID=UPI0033F119A1